MFKGLTRRFVINRRMAALAVVKHLYVIEDRGPGLLARVESGVMDQFLFQRGKKTLHGSIVETLSFSAHGLPDPCSSQDFAIFLTCILTAAIRMIDEPGTGTLPSQSHTEGRAAQIRLHPWHNR